MSYINPSELILIFTASVQRWKRLKVLNVYNILSSEFTIWIDPSSPPLLANLENEVERLWKAEQKKHGNKMFNGHIISASTFTAKEIRGFVVDYRYLIAQRARPELFEYLQVRPVAVSGLLMCSDGIIFGRRAGSVTQDSNFWELVPSGGIDTSAICNIVKVDYISQLFTELQEEVGIKYDSVSNVKPFCLVDDTESHVLDIGIALKSQITHDQVLKSHRESATKEYDELRIIPISEINKFIHDKSSQLVTVSTVLIQQFFKSHLI